MPKENQNRLSDTEIKKLLEELENQGKQKWLERWQSHILFPQFLNPTDKSQTELERVLRYLLFRVLINQQAKVDKVREIAVKIAETFEDELLFEPQNLDETLVFQVFREIAGEKGSLLYRVGALGGIKPISLFAYRFKSYEGFIKWLSSNKTTLERNLLNFSIF